LKKALKAIQGIYFERILPETPSVDDRWKNWKYRHPATKLMK
jgi:hypothetical protein